MATCSIDFASEVCTVASPIANAVREDFAVGECLSCRVLPANYYPKQLIRRSFGIFLEFTVIAEIEENGIAVTHGQSVVNALNYHFPFGVYLFSFFIASDILSDR